LKKKQESWLLEFGLRRTCAHVVDLDQSSGDEGRADRHRAGVLKHLRGWGEWTARASAARPQAPI
jgi:hypothetical protein